MDPKMEAEARTWIEACLGDAAIFSSGFVPGLRDGCVLCNLVNYLKPGLLPKPKKSARPFDMMENVSAYLRACKVLGVPDHELFQTVDLTEEKSMKAVLINIHSLGRTAQRLKDYSGPVLGAKLATANSREFNDAQKVGTYLSKIGSASEAATRSRVAASEHKVLEQNLYPVEQAELTLLQMLAQAAAVALKKWKVQKAAVEKATSEAAKKDEVAREAAATYAQAEKSKDAAKAAAAKAEAEAAEAEAAEAQAAARRAKESEAQAERAAKLAEAAYQAALQEAKGEEMSPTDAGLPSAAPPAGGSESSAALVADSKASATFVAEALASAPALKQGGGREEELSKELEAAVASLSQKTAECKELKQKLQACGR